MNKEEIAQYDQKFPEKDYKKRSFSFSPQEIRELQNFSSFQQMGLLAEKMMNQIINGVFLKRVGVPVSPDVGVLYDIPTGTALVYTPKVFCVSCQSRKASFQYSGRFYCQSCIDVLKQQLEQAKKDTKEEKPKENKVKGKKPTEMSFD